MRTLPLYGGRFEHSGSFLFDAGCRKRTARPCKAIKIKLKRDLKYEDWGTVITGIKAELNKTSPRSKKGQAKVEFYRQMMDECDYLKDVWQNNIFHGRTGCDEFDSQKAFGKVKDFMGRLAAHGFNESIPS